MSAVAVDVPFEGGSVPCVIDGNDPAPRVALRPVCEALGLDFEGQHERLCRQPWAVVTDAELTGSPENVAVIDRVTFAMWLATISAGRFKQREVRDQIERYQKEAVRALDRHFSSPSQTLPAAELIGELVERQVACERRIAALEAMRNGEPKTARTEAE
jgi:hypothetical protein